MQDDTAVDMRRKLQLLHRGRHDGVLVVTAQSRDNAAHLQCSREGWNSEGDLLCVEQVAEMGTPREVAHS